MKIGLIREWKQPADKRVALTPALCAELKQKYPQVDIVVEESPDRTYTSAEYRIEGIEVVTDMTDCDVLLGIKEVPIDKLIPNKTYLFFSHTVKEQEYNRPLLQAVLAKNISLIDLSLIHI